MSLYAELKRRAVLKVGAAYLVVAWLVVQVASIAFPAFDAPPWALRVFILMAMLGFPIAVVLAWVLEITPDGVRHEPSSIGNKRVFGIGAGFAVLAIAWYVVGQPALRPDQVAVPAPAAIAPVVEAAPPTREAPSAKSIAVLPFVNMSADEDNAYFSDGISEELLNALVRVPGLGVASRTSSFAYKNSALGAGEIARELGVAHLLEGSVRKDGQRVRITAQLIDAGADRHVWSETYDRELTDIFAIQDEIARAIVAALEVQLAGKDPAAPVVRADTENIRAYDTYQKARELFIARRNLPESVRLFERAIELDPGFARAHEGLAAVAGVSRSWGHSDRDYLAIANRAAARALELDPTLSMPWAVQGAAERSTWPIDYARQLGWFEKALAADPRNATALLWRAISWIELGFFDRALADLDRCLELEPRYHNCRSHRALALLLRGDEDEALAELERTVADGAYVSRSDHFVVPLLRRGNRMAAYMLFDENEVEPELRAIVFDALERPDKPRPDIATIKARFLSDPDAGALRVLGASRIYLWLGAFEEIAAADDASVNAIIAWERDPPAFRNSPAMKRRLVDMGVAAYWQAKGYPPQCAPRAADGFHCE